MKLAKTFAALAVAPVVAAAVYTYARFLYNFAAESILVYWSFWTGLALYPVFQKFVARPSKAYIFEHEMTHALFAVLTGSRVKKISVKKDNGSVVVDKTNSLITLAPYFFPLYAVMIFGVWKLSALLRPVILPWAPAAHFAFASALSFHFFMTAEAILHGQSDIKSDGVFFSLAVIFSLYVLVSVFLLKFLFGSSAVFGDIGGFLKEIWMLSAAFYAWLWRVFYENVIPAARRIIGDSISKG
jgi:hypothetical protein